MSAAQDFVVRPEHSIADVDLTATYVRLRDGRRLTDDLAEQLADETLAAVGQPDVLPDRP